MLLALLLSACQQTNLSQTTALNAISKAPFCDVAEPFRWSGKDTRPTQEQAVEHNAVGKELCGWGKK
jgi:hypothetical protein